MKAILLFLFVCSLFAVSSCTKSAPILLDKVDIEAITGIYIGSYSDVMGYRGTYFKVELTASGEKTIIVEGPGLMYATTTLSSEDGYEYTGSLEDFSSFSIRGRDFLEFEIVQNGVSTYFYGRR